MNHNNVDTPSALQPFEAAVSRLGKQWITQHRANEMKGGNAEKRRLMNGYFADEALAALEGFKRDHFDSKCAQNEHGSSVAERVKYFYPELFLLLRCRLEAMFVQVELRKCRERFEFLEESYCTDLAAAWRLARHLTGKERNEYLYIQFRHAFYGAYQPLKALLSDLVAFGRAALIGS